MAVLLIAFHQPETTAQVINSLRAAAPRRLYFAVDGPRRALAGEADHVARVRDLAATVDWPCSLQTRFLTENLGPRHAVSSAIDWFFTHEESGIILEHDCVAHPSFFGFCDAMLERYRDDPRVMHVGGNYFQARPVGDASYYFSRIPHIWGWATWRRAWRYYDVDMASWRDYRDAGRLVTNIPWAWQRQKWRYVLDKVALPRARTWDYQWTFTLFRHQGLAVTPNVNLVSNIGFGPRAVHGRNPAHPFANMPRSAMPEPLVHPSAIVADDGADYVTCRQNFRFHPLKVAIRNAASAMGAI